MVNKKIILSIFIGTINLVLQCNNCKSDNLKAMFYNPENDSIEDALRITNDIHEKILNKTDFSKGIIPIENYKYFDLVKDSSVPQNIQDEEAVIELITELFDGAVRWHSPRVMYNATPTPLIYTVISNFLASLYNPNLIWDTTSGKMALAEQRVIKQLSEYIGLDWRQAGGAFVSGGKATNLYGAKIGLRKAYPESQTEGINKKVIIISTKACHPCHISIGEWLGIGTKNVFRINTLKDNTIDLADLRQTMQDAIEKNIKIAAIMLSGGTTNNVVVDPIKEVVEIRDNLVKKNKLDYSPHIHVDAVIGWAWIFFKDYSFEENPLQLKDNICAKFKKIISNLKYINLADSIGLDFHKIGFCPYSSSLFLVKHKRDFYKESDNFGEYGSYAPYSYTLEQSRPVTGAIAAYVALNTLGVDGFQKLLAIAAESADNLRNSLETTEQFKIINKNEIANAIIFAPKLPHQVRFSDPTTEKRVRDCYTAEFIKRLKFLGNPFLLDKIPAYSTGSETYPYATLKAYILSPFANNQTNNELVSTLLRIKTDIDRDFNFEGNDNQNIEESIHPLKAAH